MAPPHLTLFQVINLVVTLVEALTTSMSQRAFPDYQTSYEYDTTN
jgi:hypothetical protein